MRGHRVKSKVSLRRLANKMGFSPAYVCELEKCRRNWNTKLSELYLNCLQQLTKEKNTTKKPNEKN